MQPVNGPFTETTDSGEFYRKRIWSTQKKPYNLPLPYQGSMVYCGGPANYGWGALHADQLRAHSRNEHLYASAYERLIGKLGDTASLGVTLAQWKQADQMISARANQLTRFTKSILHRNPIGVAASLGLRSKDVQKLFATRYGVAGKLSDLWLEFWFGWKPLVNDINSSMEVFNNPIPSLRLRAQRGEAFSSVYDPFPPSGRRQEVSGYRRCSVGVECRLINPNLHLLNQFGLLNLGSVAYDAVPWSFVLGWVSNSDAWLRSFTDFAGIETSNGYRYWVTTGTGRDWIPNYPHFFGGAFSGVVKLRETLPKLPRPSFQMKELSIKPARALTAISLLTQQLKRL